MKYTEQELDAVAEKFMELFPDEVKDRVKLSRKDKVELAGTFMGALTVLEVRFNNLVKQVKKSIGR